MRNVFIMFSLMLLLSGCSTTKSDYSNFSFNFSVDTSIAYLKIEEIDIDVINLDNCITISSDDILEYKIRYLDENPIRGHSFFLKEDALSKLTKHCEENSIRDMPFIIKLGNKRFSIGEYWPAPSGGRMAQSLQLVKYGSDFFRLDGTTEKANSIINSSTFINALEDSGIEISYKNIGR